MIVVPFLVIRSITNIVLTIIYVFLGYDEQKSTGVITAVLLGVTSVVVYTGVVVVGFEKEWYLQNSVIPKINVDQIGDGVTEVTEQFDGLEK